MDIYYMEKLYVSVTFNVKVCPNTSSISPSWRFRKYEGADVKNGPRVLVKWGPETLDVGQVLGSCPTELAVDND